MATLFGGADGRPMAQGVDDRISCVRGLGGLDLIFDVGSGIAA